VSCGGSTVLYWPGIRRDSKELSVFFEQLTCNGYEVQIVPPLYDVGMPPEFAENAIKCWLHDSANNKSNWWVGLSLGASIAHVVAATIHQSLCPQRLTLINPFSDRVELSHEKGFSLQGQWCFVPHQFRNDFSCADIVLSKDDQHVSNHHGRRMLSCYASNNVRLLELSGVSHDLADGQKQSELVDALLGHSERAGI